MKAKELKVTIIEEVFTVGAMEKKVNDWLRKYPELEIVDIKFAYREAGKPARAVMIIWKQPKK